MVAVATWVSVAAVTAVAAVAVVAAVAAVLSLAAKCRILNKTVYKHPCSSLQPRSNVVHVPPFKRPGHPFNASLDAKVCNFIVKVATSLHDGYTGTQCRT